MLRNLGAAAGIATSSTGIGQLASALLLQAAIDRFCVLYALCLLALFTALSMSSAVLIYLENTKVPSITYESENRKEKSCTIYKDILCSPILVLLFIYTGKW